MNIIEINSMEYNTILKTPFSIFESVAFCELNRSRINELKYFVFNNGKNRFCLVAGLQKKIIKIPFSAPYGCLSIVSKNNKISNVHDAISSLVEWGIKNGFSQIEFNLPPHFYYPKYLTMIYNALHCSGFIVRNIDVNYEFLLKNFNKDYEMLINPKSRQKLRSSKKKKMIFKKIKELSLAYRIIKKNRKINRFPISMSENELKKVSKIINIDNFIVETKDGEVVSAAIIYHVSKHIIRVIYWGDTKESRSLHSMNFLSYKIFEYYSNSKIKYIDIGHSTLDSIPNFGLCNFKASLGCLMSPKFSFIKIIN